MPRRTQRQSFRNKRGGSERLRYSRTIMTSVDFTAAATVWPFFKRISPTASAVMMDVIRCPPRETVTWRSGR